MGMIREFVYWLKSCGKEIAITIGVFLAYMAVGTIITTLFYFFATAVGDKTSTDDYCSWTPERPVTSIYWVVEYLPRKATCFVWNKW